MSSWSCFNCTFENAAVMPACEICGTVKESTWWKCVDCNFARNSPSSELCLNSGCGKRRVAEFISRKPEMKSAPAPTPARPEIKVQEVEEYVCPVPIQILPLPVRLRLIGQQCTCKGCLRNRAILATFAREFVGDVKTACAGHIGKPGTFFRCDRQKAPDFINTDTVKALVQDIGFPKDKIALMANRMSQYPVKTKMIYDQSKDAYKIICPSCACDHDIDRSQMNCRVIRCGTNEQHETFENLTKSIKDGTLPFAFGCLRGIAFVKESDDYFAYATDLNDFIIP